MAEIGRAVVRLIRECPECRDNDQLSINALIGILKHDMHEAWSEPERERLSMAIRMMVEESMKK